MFFRINGVGVLYRVFDDYLNVKQRSALLSELDSLDEMLLDNESQTEIEKKKQVYRLDVLPNEMKNVICLFGSEKSKNVVREMTGWKGNVYSLLEMPDFGGYAPFHSMKTGGFLGSHVDHTFVESGKYVHVANCIYYAHKKWSNQWHGETTFYSRFGFFLKHSVIPQENRMLFFVHDAESFHGVADVKCPADIVRQTFYMDFYIHFSDLKSFLRSFENTVGRPFVHCKVSTTFFPFRFNGAISFLRDVLSAKTRGYARIYLRYVTSKLFKRIYS